MPRKTDAGARRLQVERAASMRPRPDAAENLISLLLMSDLHAASMRPRPDAAENAPTRPSDPMAAPRFNEAAARCRGKRPDAAENVRAERRLPVIVGASMRPRPDAAENGDRPCFVPPIALLQ